MDIRTWYLKTSKLALALAIIHSKPADKSSREYAEHLALLVSQQESTWKSKVEALEAEVLCLRQKLFLSRTCSELHKNAQEPTSSETTLPVMNDSGCDLSNEQRSEPSELSQCFVDSGSTPPVLPLPLRKRRCATVENALSSHMQFLQHLLEVKKLTESGSLKADLTHFEEDSSIISDSVSQLLEGLITFYRHPRLPFSCFWTEAVGTLARLNSDFNLSNHIFEKCSKKLEEFVKTLLQTILENNRMNRVQASYNVTRYENIFSLFWILEQLLLKETEGDPTSLIDPSDQEIKKFLQKHDETIFQLSDAFPLFTFYLWRLGILLNSAKRENGE